MTARLQAWIPQAENDLAMAEFARSGQFYAQSCYHCSQAAEKTLIGLLIGLGQGLPAAIPSNGWSMPWQAWAWRLNP